jgi:hypothetical protein
LLSNGMFGCSKNLSKIYDILYVKKDDIYDTRLYK